MDTIDLDQQLNDMIILGNSVDALSRFYAEDVVVQENDEPERVGRAAWIAGRRQAERNINKFNARVLAQATNGDTSFSEWEYKVEIAGMGSVKIAQVAVRRWRDGKVVRERFYHK